MNRTDSAEIGQIILTHLLTTQEICEPAKEELTDKGTDRGRDLDAEILMRVQLLTYAVYIAQHCGGNVDGEDIIAGTRGS